MPLLDGLPYSPSTLTVTFCIILFLIYAQFLLTNLESTFVKNSYKTFFILIVFFVEKLLKENIAIKHLMNLPWFLLLFLNILFCNLLGMLPYTFTVTSSLITTFYYSLSYFISLNVIGVCLHFLQFMLLFLPPGTPLLMMPFLIMIEVLSYFASVFSLAMSLFANLMSGHTLLHILAGVAWFNLVNGVSKLGFVFMPWVMIFMITGLETVIGGMQAYVFMILLAIYSTDVMSLH